MFQGWIQHDLGGGGGALPALVPSCVGHVCRPPINLLHYSSNIGTVRPLFLRVRKGAEGALINIHTNEGA